MPGLALDPDEGCVGIGAAHDVQDGFVAVGRIFDRNEEAGLLGWRAGSPALWEEVGWVGRGGESAVEGCQVLCGEIGG